MDPITNQIIDLFLPLCAIPHPSGEEAAIGEHIMRTLTAFGLSPEMDSAYNIRCLLPATPGREHAGGVILQAHTDMVCVSAPGSCYVPQKDPVHTVMQDGWLCSDGHTTLGADNGIGVALMLWLAGQQFPHGDVLLLFTACEEQGLVGAKALDGAWLKGMDYYINLDAFRGDGVIFASAGGLRQQWCKDIAFCPPTKSHAFRIALSGLTGGHSGFDIHRGRQNSIALLLELVNRFSPEVAALSGGSNFNAIPTQAAATVVTDDPDAFLAGAQAWVQEVQQRCRESDPGLTLEVMPCPLPQQVWSQQTLDALTQFFHRLPMGVQAMRTDLPDTVADSGNPAMLTQADGVIQLCHFTRCATLPSIQSAELHTAQAAREFGFERREVYYYAPWEGSAENKLTRLLPELERVALHVGLESSLFMEKAPGLTGVALGFDILDAHAVTERVRLDSIRETTARVLYLLDMLSKEETK